MKQQTELTETADEEKDVTDYRAGKQEGEGRHTHMENSSFKVKNRKQELKLRKN